MDPSIENEPWGQSLQGSMFYISRIIWILIENGPIIYGGPYDIIHRCYRIRTAYKNGPRVVLLISFIPDISLRNRAIPMILMELNFNVSCKLLVVCVNSVEKESNFIQFQT